MKKFKVSGMTLLEVLLIVAGITIIIGIVIMIIDPNKELGNKNNVQRRVDVKIILNAISQYSLDNRGTLPPTISTSSKEICQTGAKCENLVDLSVLTDDEKYLSQIPTDPKNIPAPSTGYTVFKTNDGKITVSAPLADKGENISATK